MLSSSNLHPCNTQKVLLRGIWVAKEQRPEDTDIGSFPKETGQSDPSSEKPPEALIEAFRGTFLNGGWKPKITTQLGKTSNTSEAVKYIKMIKEG